MVKALKITGLVVLALLLLLLAAVFVLPKTGPGRALIDRYARPAIETAVRDQLGSEIAFSPIEGALPGEFVIRDIVLSKDGEPWARIGRARLDWSPFALLSRKIVVDELAVDDAILLREPPPLPEDEPKPEEEDQAPFQLPDITVKRLAITPFAVHERVLGERYAITAVASLRTPGGQVKSEAFIATAEGTDRLAVDVDYTKARLRGELLVESDGDGLLARLAEAGGPLTLSIDGEGPLNDWQGELMADLARYGGAAAVLSGDLKTLESARFDGAIRPGPAWPSQAAQYLGERLVLDAAASRGEDGAVIVSLGGVEARFGALSGTVTLSSFAAERVEADLDGRLSEAVAGELGFPAFAGAVALDAEAAQTEGGWAFEGVLDTDVLTAQVADGQSTESVLFEGDVALSSARGLDLPAGPAAPLLSESLEASASLRYGAEGDVVIEGLDLRIGRGRNAVAATGEARFATETERFSTDLSLNAAPGALVTLLGAGEYDTALSAEIQAEGTLKQATARLSAQIPSGEIDGTPFPAGALTADLSGLPAAPSGTVTLQSAEAGYQGRVVLNSEGDAILVPELAFSAQGLSLSGEARLLPEAMAGSARLRLEAAEGTTLFTGATLEGTALIDAEIGPDLGPVDITAIARGLRYAETRIDALRFDAQGPRGAIDWGLSLDDAELPGVFLALLNTAGTANLEAEAPVIGINELRAAVDEDVAQKTVTLLEPTTLTLGETIALETTRLDWLGGAVLTASAVYGPDRWAAELRGERLEIPEIEGVADIDLSLDTRRENPGQFTLTATAGEDGRRVTVSGDGLWTGERVAAEAVIEAAGFGEIASAEFSFPAILRRGETLSVEIPEEGLAALLRYDGPIEPLYAFVPLDTEYLTGRLEGAVELSGAVTAPIAEGRLTLADGRFEEDQIGVVIRDIEGTADFGYSGDAVEVALDIDATGADGREGAIDLAGEVRLGGENSAVDLRLALADAQLADTAELELEASGELSLTGALDSLALAGALRIDELDTQIPALSGDEDTKEYVPVNVVRVDGPKPELTEEVEAPEPPLAIALDLSIEADNAIFVRGRGLDSEWRADLTINGTTLAPVIGGEVALLSGTFLFAGRTFDITEGLIDFRRTDEIDPRVAVTAEYETDEDVTAIVRVEGPVSDPSITLSSNPSLPDETVLALILFGKEPTQLTELEALQLAYSVAQLTGAGPLGGGGAGITDKLRSSLGLDALSIGTAESGAAVVEVGKYVTDDVYVSARQAADQPGTEVTVNYEVTDHITVESTLEPDGSQEVSANYKIDY